MMTDPEELWPTCRAILRKQVPEPTWNTWLAPLMLLEADESHFVVGAPNSMIFERVATRYQGMIEGALAEATSTNAVKLELVVHEVDDDASSGSRRWCLERQPASFSRSKRRTGAGPGLNAKCWRVGKSCLTRTEFGQLVLPEQPTGLNHAQPPLHLRGFRNRRVQPVRSRRRPASGRRTGEGL